MNCQIARQTLELFRPDENSAANLGEAEQHVNDCLDCQEAVGVRQQVDLRIGRMCRDVNVPVGLKDRLLTELAAAAAVETSEASQSAALVESSGNVVSPQSCTSVQPAVGTRRRWLLRSLVAAGVAVTGISGAWILIRPPAPTIVLEDVMKQVLGSIPEKMVGFQGFRSGVALQLPTTMDARNLNGAALQQLNARDVAVYSFTICDGAGRPVNGRLIVIPLAAVIDLPSGTSFLAGPALYSPPYCTTAWVEKGKGLVYVCCVKGDEHLLQQLLPRPV
jgi:hypothetical protein